MISAVFNKNLIIFLFTFGLLYLSNPIVGVHFKNPEYKIPENHYYNPSAPSPPGYPSYSEGDMKGSLDTSNTPPKKKGKKLKTALALGAAGLGAATLLGGGYHLYKRLRPQAAATAPSVPGSLTPTIPSVRASPFAVWLPNKTIPIVLRFRTNIQRLNQAKGCTLPAVFPRRSNRRDYQQLF